MTRFSSRHSTSPFIWCLAIICAIISVAVIIGGIAVFAGYMVIHPRVPILSVEYAHLDLLKYGFPPRLFLLLLIFGFELMIFFFD